MREAASSWCVCSDAGVGLCLRGLERGRASTDRAGRPHDRTAALSTAPCVGGVEQLLHVQGLWRNRWWCLLCNVKCW